MRPPFLRPIRQLLIGAVALVSTACASGGRAALSPADAPAALRVYDTGAKRFVSFAQFANAVAANDLVFFGEQHDDPAGDQGRRDEPVGTISKARRRHDGEDDREKDQHEAAA